MYRFGWWKLSQHKHNDKSRENFRNYKIYSTESKKMTSEGVQEVDTILQLLDLLLDRFPSLAQCKE